MPVPPIRIRIVNPAPINPNADFVLYWMIANRRPTWNFSLDRAMEWAVELHKPLVILEALRCGYNWASDRLHAFILQGMADNAAWFAQKSITYLPYVEPSPGDGSGLLARLARQANVIVTDDFPCFFLPRMLGAAAQSLAVRLEAVDSNGLLPLRATDRVFSRAVDFRRFLQKTLAPHLIQPPLPDALADSNGLPRLALDDEILQRWQLAQGDALSAGTGFLAGLPIDHAVPVAPAFGGHAAAQKRLRDFLQRQLPDYGTRRNEPEQDVASGLSPYLHFGHISVHQVLSELARIEDWQPSHVSTKAAGKREGWWGMSASAEAFLDELVTWREIGYNMASHSADYDKFDSLPEWAKATLDAHVRDKRVYLYSLDEFESAATHDPLWNAAQNQLRREGRIHNYLRMLWGKKILHWSKSPRDALDVMIELNNKYALDGRDPNSYSGIFWVLGRYDRPWGPERPIFGTVRYMTSESTARKYDVNGYIKRYTD